jgi:hypothetical protein
MHLSQTTCRHVSGVSYSRLQASAAGASAASFRPCSLLAAVSTLQTDFSRLQQHMLSHFACPAVCTLFAQPPVSTGSWRLILILAAAHATSSSVLLPSILHPARCSACPWSDSGRVADHVPGHHEGQLGRPRAHGDSEDAVAQAAHTSMRRLLLVTSLHADARFLSVGDHVVVAVCRGWRWLLVAGWCMPAHVCHICKLRLVSTVEQVHMQGSAATAGLLCMPGAVIIFTVNFLVCHTVMLQC